MTDSRDQSYYEIALTNRQVMTVFVVLLVCLLTAFLGGVWMGRGGAPAVRTVEAQAIDYGTTADETPLEELDFFASQPAADNQVEQPETEGDYQQPVIIEETPATPPPTLVDDAQVETTPPVATESPAQTEPEPVPETGRDGAAATPPVTDFVVVQVFSSTDVAQAERVLAQLRDGGYPALMSPVDVDGQPMYRVRVGPYTDRDEAQSVADRVRRAYKLDTWITR